MLLLAKSVESTLKKKKDVPLMSVNSLQDGTNYRTPVGANRFHRGQAFILSRSAPLLNK